MSFTNTKETVYNLTLSALLLNKEVIEVSTDKTNEVSVLNKFYDIALQSTLEDLDLTSLSEPITLELIAELSEGPWTYVYKYPTNCAFLRRLESGQPTDNKTTHIPKRTGLYQGQAAIYTDEYDAVADCIPFDVPLGALSSMATLALSFSLASLCAPLLTGKGAKRLKDSLDARYVVAKTQAQAKDARENFNYEADWIRSEFVEARIS